METYQGRPSVNVKIRNGPTVAQLAKIEREQGPSAAGFAKWYADEDRDSDGTWQSIAQEDAVQEAQDDADMIFGKGTTVSLEGRSGGHLTVTGLFDQDLEEDENLAEWKNPGSIVRGAEKAPDWPADSEGWKDDREGIVLTASDSLAHRWRYFAACAKSASIDFPRRVADLVCANVYIPMMEAQAAKEAEYQERERAHLFRQLQEIERAPLSERREARAEWAEALKTPTLIQERVGWLLDGNYGKGSYDRAHAIVRGSARSNKPAQLGQLIAALEWRCPNAFAREAFLKLTPNEQDAVTEAVTRAMREVQS